jgi:hypothetical protein
MSIDTFKLKVNLSNLLNDTTDGIGILIFKDYFLVLQY